MTTYNGHRSWAYWNVSLWINGDEGLYRLALNCVRQSRTRRQAAAMMLDALKECAPRGENAKTPDGAEYDIDKIISAMRGME